MHLSGFTGFGISTVTLQEAGKRVRRNAKGKPTQKLTSYLTSEEGKPRLRELLEGAKALMRISIDWNDYYSKLEIAYPKFGDTLIIPFEGGLPRLSKPKTIPSGE